MGSTKSKVSPEGLSKPTELVSDHPISFSVAFAAFEILVIILFGVFTAYDVTVGAITTDTATPIQSIYPLYQDVNVMVFVGFGFLMTFLRKYSYSAVGLTFLGGVLCLQWGILNVGFWNRVFGMAWNKINLTVAEYVSYLMLLMMMMVDSHERSLVNGDFAAAAMLISFGAVIGRVTPTQFLFMCIVEMVFYGLNNALVIEKLGLADIGGTYTIHMFGAYYGLVISKVLSMKVCMGLFIQQKYHR